MSSLILGLFASLLLNLIAIKFRSIHIKWTIDEEIKYHSLNFASTPRIGGLSIFIALCIVIIYEILKPNSNWYPAMLLLTASLPIFFLGFLEDITKKITAIIRLFGSFLSASLFIYLLQVGFEFSAYTEIIKYLIYFGFILFIATLINSYNLIDGLNGLASMVGVITLAGICYIAYRVDDWMIIHISMVVISVIFGFFILNYPRAFIYLGDSGAYLLGFMVSSLSLLLILRNGELSYLLLVLLNIYPLFEIVFTILRRVLARTNPMIADKIHLHSLLYRKIKIFLKIGTKEDHTNTTPFMWMLASLGVFPAALFWNDELALAISIMLFLLTYLAIYFFILYRLFR